MITLFATLLHNAAAWLEPWKSCLLNLPKNTLKFLDYPGVFNFFQIFPIYLTIAYVLIFLRVLYEIYIRSKLYSGIPYVKGLPFIGLAHRLFAMHSKTDVHEEALDLVTEYGPIMQFFLFGKHFMMLNDGALVRQALDEMKGKGEFHVSSYLLPLYQLEL